MTDDAHVHKEHIAGLYGRVAATYGRIGPDLFAPFGRFLVTHMQLSPGEWVWMSRRAEEPCSLPLPNRWELPGSW